jgi:hypothetical protein
MTANDELAAMAAIHDILEGLDDASARGRVVRWAADSFDVAVSPAGAAARGPSLDVSATNGGTSLVELLDQAQPESRADKILVVAYWLESTSSGADWSAQAVNDELKNLGAGVPNITDALSGLIAKKPALVRQVRKTGRAQQARKRYLLTAPGRAAVSGMLSSLRT